MALVQTFKVATLPATPVADAIYYVKGPAETKHRVWVTTTAGVAREIDAVTEAALTAALALKENVIAAGTTAQYWRGDKTWQTLNKAAVGLGNVDNTADIDKPLSNADIAALALKANDNAVVHLTGNESIAGIKTFSSSPLVPNATTAGQAAAYGQVTAGDAALQTQIDNINTAIASGLEFKGTIDASTNPNYPAASVGDVYIVNVAGKVGGASGVDVENGDMLICRVASAAGSQATVGANWNIVQSNLGAATETTIGYSRKATTAEATAGTSDVGFMTPLKTQQKIDATAVKWDVAQSLTAPQQSQARTNIGAAAATSIAGTTGKLAKFTASGTIGDSIVTETAGAITVAGTLQSDLAPNANLRGMNLLNGGGLSRWGVGKAGLESGSDAGSDFVIWRYNDAGTFLGEAVKIVRSTGAATFSGTVSVATPTAPGHATTKAYVDAIGAGLNWAATEW
ncbi:hypothetical protein [Dyadobacter fermentans]|uniref:hypothetical protein n=1 Tax=Dyadobacter fermentans TaxID=94254 RepID=UPI001CBF2988|nr:hypothetical protein [Dyadobacter fermentans]MBZ1362133.1 hypothetical protein [Dyadobacter fermentans]